MGLVWYTRGQTSVIIRVKIFDSSSPVGAGLTGLTHNSPGLIISTIADNEETPVVYTQAAATIDTITTLGTYEMPSISNSCRFREVHATYHKGIYEIHLADARFAVAGSTYLLISIAGAANAADTDVVIPLTLLDPQVDNFNATGLASYLDVQVVNASVFSLLQSSISATTTVTADEPPTVDDFTVGSTKPTGWYDDHQIVFTSGALNGLTRIITSHTNFGTYSKFGFDEPLPQAPVIGVDLMIKADHEHSRTQVASSVVTSMLVVADNFKADAVDIANQVDTTLSSSHGAGSWEGSGGGSGPGGIEWIITIRDTAGDPLGNVAVWVTTDAAGLNVVAGTSYTDDHGRVTFMLTAGTYYLWRNSPKYNFTNPQTMVVS